MVLKENSLMSIEKEATYDTDPAASSDIFLVSSGVPVTDAMVVEREDDNAGSIFALDGVPTQLKHSLSVGGKVYPEIIGFILANLLGDPASAVDDVTAYSHKKALLEAGIGVNSLTLKSDDGGIGSDLYTGFVFNTLTIRGGKEGFITFEGTGAAKTRNTPGGAVSGTISTIKPYRYFNADVSYGGASIDVDSWSITIDVKLLLENFKQNQTIEQPVINGRPAVTATIERFFTSRSSRTDYEAGTKKQLLVTLTHSDDIAGSSTPWSLTMELPSTQIMTAPVISGDTGQMSEALDLKGFAATSADLAVNTTFEYSLVDLETTH